MRQLLRTAALASLIFALPLAVHADDQQVASEVAGRLKENLKGYSVVVKVQDGTAWLNGSVSNQRQMATALQIAHQTQGVDFVVNNLTIGNPSPSEAKPSIQQQQRPMNMQMPPEQAFAGGMPYGPPNGAPMQYDPRMMQASMPPAAFHPANQPLPLAMGGGDIRQAS
ncbi:MAG TPA: BON domain-containing protein, partial [Pirellulales bacterium]